MIGNNDDAMGPVCRAFACWAARRAWGIVGCRPCEDVVLAVEAYARDEIGFTEVCRARQAAAGGVAGAGTCGMPRAIPAAAAQIAAWHTADDSAEAAAQLVIQHVACAAGFRALQRASDTMALTAAEAKSSWRNYDVWRREPQIEFAARSIERAFLQGELRRRLSAVKGGER